MGSLTHPERAAVSPAAEDRAWLEAEAIISELSAKLDAATAEDAVDMLSGHLADAMVNLCELPAQDMIQMARKLDVALREGELRRISIDALLDEAIEVAARREAIIAGGVA